MAAMLLWNESSWDRKRANTALTLAASAQRAANGDTGDLTNYNAWGLHLIVDVTALSGTTPSVTITVEGKDPASGKYYTVLASAALNAVATTVLKVAPSLTAAANLVANDILPRNYRVRWTIGGSAGPTVTFSLGASFIM